MIRRWSIPKPKGGLFRASPDGSVFLEFDDKIASDVLKPLFENMHALASQAEVWSKDAVAAPPQAPQGSLVGQSPLQIQPPSVNGSQAGMIMGGGGGPGGATVPIRPPPPPGSHLTPYQTSPVQQTNASGVGPLPQPPIMAPPPPPTGMDLKPAASRASNAERPTIHAPAILGRVATPSKGHLQSRTGALPAAEVAKRAEEAAARQAEIAVSLQQAVAIVHEAEKAALRQAITVVPPGGAPVILQAPTQFLDAKVVAAKIEADRIADGPPVSREDGRVLTPAVTHPDGKPIAILPQPPVLAPPPPPVMQLVDAHNRPISTGR